MRHRSTIEVSKMLMWVALMVMMLRSIVITDQSVTAQSLDNCVRQGDSIPPSVQIPSDFPWVTYSYTFADPANRSSSPRVVSRIDRNGVTSLTLPPQLDVRVQSRFPGEVVPTQVSPDGRLLLFHPIFVDAPFVVWDMETDEVAEYWMTPDQQVIYEPFPIAYTLADEWVDDRTLQIDFHRGIVMLSRQTLNVSTDPLIVTPENYIIVDNSWALPSYNTDSTPVQVTSPSLQYVVVNGVELMQTANGRYSRGGMDLFERNSMELKFSQLPTLQGHYGGRTSWSPDENYLYFRLRYGFARPYSEPAILDLQDNFTMVDGVVAAIDNAVPGDGIGVTTSVKAEWSNDNTMVAFIIVSPELSLNYVVIYDVPQNEAQVFCLAAGVGYDDSVPFWTPDDRYYGYNTGSGIYLFDRITGETYRLPETMNFTGFVPFGSSPVASAGPDQTVNEAELVTLDGRGSSDSDGATDSDDVVVTVAAG